MFQKGHKRIGGMKKGQITKQKQETIKVKEAILTAFDKGGGVKWLQKQMDENPSAFMTLLAKTLPLDANINANVLTITLSARLQAAEEKVINGNG